MLTLAENERILLTVRKHWFLMVRPAIIFFVFLLVPVAISLLTPYLATVIPESVIRVSANFFITLYLAALIAFLFFAWTDYYLDVWIITTRRIIDVEQNGFFDRHVAEIPLARVQDITIEVKGVFETFLHFGTIRIQTAGERDFFIEDVPQLQKIKDTILAQVAQENRGYVRPPVVQERS